MYRLLLESTAMACATEIRPPVAGVASRYADVPSPTMR
jgi:hypothetical protein